MMKKLLFLLFLPLLFSCKSEKKENDLTRNNIKGKVKEIIETEFNFNDPIGELQKDFFKIKSKYKYNEDGNVTESSYYDKDGELSYKSKYKYDEDGNVTESSYYDKDGELSYKYKYKYDEDGNQTEVTSYDKNKMLLSKFKYKYNEDGNVTESSYYDKDGELSYKYKYKYEFDKKNNWIVKNSSKDDKYESITKREIEYYDDGDPILDESEVFFDLNENDEESIDKNEVEDNLKEIKSDVTVEYLDFEYAGLNMKFPKLSELKIMENANNNVPGIIVQLFNDLNFRAILVYVSYLPSYTTHKEVTPEKQKSFLKGALSSYDNYILESTISTKVDGYPAIQAIFETTVEETGQQITMKGIQWSVFIEDLAVTICGTTTKDNFNQFLPEFNNFTILSSFPDQYSSNIYNSSFVFQDYVDKFYREVNAFGIYPPRPNRTIIELKDLDKSQPMAHVHGVSYGTNNDDIIKIFINKRSWNNMNKAQKHYLIFHELCHDVLNLDDLDYLKKNELKIMYPALSTYDGSLKMDAFIYNFHAMLRTYKSYRN